ncbi:lipopolysaccharide biosynthesis protein [Flavobacterium sp. B183]|uniref:lipopolysaccharide biosynthesis protein n=1 Tax=Flavobacterium sp. B183 TaxID=907046 RepID=UPI00201F7255|nr:oligosaccharide flippase family protein [Flavobacterium sp. B183]URC13112.1 oligosaccharide flippase family protein [Flavobacterium sp. B183]
MLNSKSLALFLKFSYGGLISAVLSFLSTPIITALVLPNEFGKASMITLGFSLLMNFVQLGADQSFVRFFYQDKYNQSTSLLLLNSIIVPVILSFVTIGVIFLLGDEISLFLTDEVNKSVPILLSLLLLVGVIERFSTLLIRMNQKGVLFSNLKIIQSLTNIIIVILYANFIKSSFIAIVYGLLISTFLTGIIGIYVERKYWLNSTSINKNDITEILKYGLPFVPTFLISWIFEGIDKIALKNYSTFSEIGLYTAAYKIVAILTIIQVTFSNFWVPISYEAYEKNSNESRKLFQNIFSGLSGLFFILAILIISFKDIIIIFFAKKYNSASIIMPFLIFMPVMYTLSEITVGGINFKNKTYWHLMISIISAFVNIIGVYFLVPLYGAIGAAISTGCAYIVFFYARTLISNYYFPLNFQLLKTTISILILFFVCTINTFISSLIFCSIINFLSLVFICFIYRNELNILIAKFLKR